MIAFLDSSVVLRVILGSAGALADFGRWQRSGMSEVLEWECLRALDRHRLAGQLTDGELTVALDQLRAVIAQSYVIRINDTIRSAMKQSLPTIVGTLDAIHLRTAELWKGTFATRTKFAIYTHDHQFAVAARALDIETRPANGQLR